MSRASTSLLNWSVKRRGWPGRVFSPETWPTPLKRKMREPRSLSAGSGRLDLTVLVVLRHERPEIVDLLFVLDAGEGHLGARNLGFGILDVLLELGLVPGDAGVLVGVRVGVIRRGSGLAAVEPVELRADLVLGAFADGVAGKAFVEGRFAGGDVLRQRGRCRDGRGKDDQRAHGRFFHGSCSGGGGGGGV